MSLFEFLKQVAMSVSETPNLTCRLPWSAWFLDIFYTQTSRRPSLTLSVGDVRETVPYFEPSVCFVNRLWTVGITSI